MINVKELRCGNIVSTADEEPELIVIDAIDSIEGTISGNGIESIGYENIYPVDLTEKLLLEKGFNTESYNDGAIGIEIDNYDIVLMKPNTDHSYFRMAIVHGGIPFLIRLDYLHQLQNLIKDLSGKEI